MDAKTFGAFLACTRRERGMTQAELADIIHVTDKAVSRWERGIGFPDINTLEPLADALGLSLSQLMHAGTEQTGQPEETMEDFLSMLRPGRIRWSGARSALFWLTVAQGLRMLCLLPAQVATDWSWTGGVLAPCRTGSTLLVALACAGISAFILQLWHLLEQGLLFVQRGLFFRGLLPLLRARHPVLYAIAEFAAHLFSCWILLQPLLTESMILLLN